MIKNNIKTKTITLGELFSKENSYVIPAYQRPYEWDEKQIENLLNNIVEFFNYNRNSGNVYLVSTIQLTVNGNNDLEVIDGHQRITTFYLLKKALGATPEFKYKNEIHGYEKGLNELVESNSLYKTNFAYIESYLKSYFKEQNIEKIDERKNFSTYLDNYIVFASIKIENNPTIEDTLQVFNTLNTTGLKLEVKDIFKIKFAKYLNKSNDSNCFNKVNEAYSSVTSPLDNVTGPIADVYSLTEDDLLDTYRFYLLSQTSNKKSYAADIRESNTVFFERYFNDKENNIEPKLNLNDFCDIAKCLKKAQQIIYERDQHVTGSDNIIKCCARDLVSESGYSKLKNIYYYLIYIQYKNTKEIDETVIKYTDEITTTIWQYCSIYRFTYSKIINHVFFKVGEAIFKNGNINKLLDSAPTVLEDDIKANDWRNFDGFKNLLEPTGNVKDCNKPHLLVILSYINDACNDTVFKIKKDTFYRTYFNTGKRKKWDLDIEHILSHSLYEKEDDVNSIGNLMYLTSSTNKALGAKTKDLINDSNRREKDFQNKIDAYKKDAQSLICVNAFLNDYEDKIGFIHDRNKKKCQFLKKVYSNFLRE